MATNRGKAGLGFWGGRGAWGVGLRTGEGYVTLRYISNEISLDDVS